MLKSQLTGESSVLIHALTKKCCFRFRGCWKSLGQILAVFSASQTFGSMRVGTFNPLPKSHTLMNFFLHCRDEMSVFSCFLLL